MIRFPIARTSSAFGQTFKFENLKCPLLLV